MANKPLTLNATKVPQLPAIPTDVSAATKAWMTAMTEALAIRLGRVGDQRDRAVTLRELIDSGLAKDLTNRPYDPNNTNDFTWFVDPPDYAIPPKPTNFTATGVFTRIILTWDEGWTVFSNFAYTEIYRHTSNALGDAIIIDITQAGVYTDNVDYNDTYYYWVRHVSTSEVRGPFSDMATATTAIDIGAVMTTLSETLSDLPGYSLLQTAASTIEIIQASGVPDENTNRADNTNPHVGDIYVNTATGQQYVRNAANNGWIIAADAALTTTVNSQASSISTNTSAISTANTNISNLTTTSSSHTTSISSLNSTVAAKVDVYRQAAAPSGGTYVSGDLWVDTDDNQLYQYNGSAWVTARDAGLATATALSTVSSTASTNASNVSTLQTTTATLTGDAAAAYVLNVNANGSVAGMVIEANASSSGDGVGSAVQFVSDKFAIWNDSNAGVAPFIVANNTVYMANAMIQNAAIDTVQIANLAVEEGKIDNLAVTNLKVASSAITEEKIYDLTVTGAKIRNATITNLHVREGTFEKAKINSLYAHSLTGDVSKSVAATLASSQTWNNLISGGATTYDYQTLLELSLPKPTHPDGWTPYASFNINKMSTDKNSWSHIKIEMAIWNVNSVGTTAVEQGNDLVGDNDGICASQSPSGAGNLTINGALASGGSVTLTTPRAITITKDNTADIGRSFVITGTDVDDDAQTETITTMESLSISAEGVKLFKTITQVAVDAAMTGNIVVGISNLISVYGNGFNGTTVYDNYWHGATGTQTDPGNADVYITWTTANIIAEDGTGAHNTSLLPTTSDWLSDGTTHRQITGAGEVGSTYVVSYQGDLVSSFGTGNIYFREAIATNGTGRYVNVAKTDWIAVDDAYNDFAIAGVWSNAGGSGTGFTRTAAAVSHGIKARMSIRGHEQHGSSEQGSDDETVEEATAFLMGVR